MALQYPSYPCKQSLGSHGWIEGLELRSPSSGNPVCHYFGGVRYAQPPTGELRFRKTRPLPADFIYGSEDHPGQHRHGCHTCPQPQWIVDFDRTTCNEDCLHTNIWVPVGEPPAKGWPVLIHIHGGFLQFGFANKGSDVVARMYEETPFRAIVITPAYRTNALGFLASSELEAEANLHGESSGNMGFWDQRTAIEWAAKFVQYFDGDACNITVSGYSAGSHSTFHQLAHDLWLPKQQSLIRRAIMWSNGSGIQPKGLASHQAAFDELLSALGIPSEIPAIEKLTLLRELPVERLINVLDSLKNSEFRGHSEGSFIKKDLIRSINNGEFGRRMSDRGVKLLIGETCDEHYLYRSWRTPKDSFEAVYNRLCGDYTEEAVQKVMAIYCPGGQLPPLYENWVDLFGKIYASLQVHSLERGFVNRLAESGLVIGKDVLRYEIEWRAKAVDAAYPSEWKVSHDTDTAIWFWGNGWGDGLQQEEKEIAAPFMRIFGDFVRGNDVEWPLKGPQFALRINPEGKTEMYEDSRWQEGLEVWEAVNGNSVATTNGS